MSAIAQLGAALACVPSRVDVAGNVEGRVVPTELGAGEGHLIVAERRAVR